jgi:HAMP domain-containing protein
MRIRTKLLTVFLLSILLLTLVSLYAQFVIGKLSETIYQTTTYKEAANDLIIHSANFVNILTLYLTVDGEKLPALKAEYDYAMGHFHHALEALRSSKRFDKYISLVIDNHGDSMRGADKLMAVSGKRLQKEENFKIIIKDLRENCLRIIDNTQQGSERLKLNVAQMGYKDKEFNFQYQDKKHADEWLETINIVKTDLKREGFNSVLSFAANYLALAESAIAERNEINDFKIKEQYYLDIVRKTDIEINIASTKIAQIVSQELSQILGQAKTQRAIFLVSIFFSFVFGNLFVFIISRNISNSVEELTKVAKLVSGGEIRQRAKTKSNDETGYLSSVFNQMLDETEKSRQELQAANQQLTASEHQLRAYNQQLIATT